MMRFNNILKEENEKSTKVSKSEIKILEIMRKQNIDPNDIHRIFDFLVDIMVIYDEDFVSRLIKLYNSNSINNFKGGFKDLSELNIGKDYSEKIKALGELLDVDPFFITVDSKGSIGNEYNTYLPTYRVLNPQTISRDSINDYIRLEDTLYSVADDDEDAHNAAATIIYNGIEENGVDYFNERFFSDFLDYNDYYSSREATYQAENEARDYDEDDMREELGVSIDYESYEDEIKLAKIEIVKKLEEIQVTEFKIENIEKEKIILEKEIERLSDYVDYGDDTLHYSEFSQDVNILQDKLNDIDSLLIENKTILELLNKEHHTLQDDIVDFKEELSKYEGDNLLNEFIDYRTDWWVNEIQDDPIGYVNNYLDGDFVRAIADGVLEFDEAGAIMSAIELDGRGHFLATYDSVEDHIQWGDNDYYVYRLD